MTLPQWLRRTRGDTTRAAQLRTCTRCRAPILVGLDADICALTVRADPTPLDEIGELVALMTGRPTYNLAGNSVRKQLDPRNEHHIRKSREYPVLPTHRCGQPLTAHITDDAPTRRPKLPPETPPF